MVSTFILGVLYAAAGGLSPRKPSVPSKSKFALKVRGWELNLLPFLIILAAVEILIFLDKLTYAAYIDTPQAFLLYLFPFLVIGLVFDLTGRAATYHARRFGLLLTLALLFSSYLAPGLAPMGPEVALTAVLLLMALALAFVVYKIHDKKAKFGVVYAALTVFALLVPTIVAATATPYAAQNPLFDSIQDNQTDGPPSHYLKNASEVRVISWELATAYLHRAYGDAASYLDTDDYTLAKYTDPTLLRGRFVWANAPVFESLKWLGDRDHPAFVYIENVPENMSREDPNVLHKVSKNLDYHMTRIEWSKRLHQKLFDKYSDFLLVQSRFDIDESLNPYMVLYLATQPSWFALPTLQRVVIVDLSTGAEADYSVTDPSIPSWLEVVYPDYYVYAWLDFWGHNRFGWGYSV
ncbi:MAG TPA: hypothetical protein VI893_05745, partial [Thermoplasmata archaeon]|nr:hypothetical protein [Thermoplasmata archaeon]